MKKAAIFTLFVLLFIFNINATEEGILHGGYCYYIDGEDIFRAPMTDMAGEIELFAKDSVYIEITGDFLVSTSSDGNIKVYSLVSESEWFLNKNNQASVNDESALLGTLSARYESNGNPAAISSGNDAGGVSFGAYQFASNAQVPKTFAEWCISSKNDAEIGERLLLAYAADGNSYGDVFKTEWLEIAKEDSNHFLSVQHAFVKEKYYDAIVSRIEKNVPGFKMDTYGIALKNVFWSRAVQHGVGGSYNVITRAFEAIGGYDLQSEDVLIKAIYAESGAVSDTGTNPMTGSVAESLGIAGKYMKYYSKNPSAVQVSVYKRLNINEPSLALQMLETYGGYLPVHTVRYFDASGNVIYQLVVSDRDNVAFEGELPTKKDNLQFSFEFSHWSEDETNIRESTDFYPVFKKTDKKWDGSVAEGFSGGNGTEAEPYLISNPKELAFLSQYTNSGGQTDGMYFSLCDNIVLGEYQNSNGFIPIGTEEHPFCGNFDGKGYVVSGLYVSVSDFGGLFGYTSDADISNVIIKKATVEADIAGILVGKAVSYTGSVIKNCSVDGSVKGVTYSGSVVGIAWGQGFSITNVHTSGYAEGKICGGVTGFFSGDMISCAFSETAIFGEKAGNICGEIESKNINFEELSNCYYSLKTTATDGIYLSFDKLSSKIAYEGFDFSSVWSINEGGACLTAEIENTFVYRVYGDVNRDGFVNVSDVVYLAQYLAKWSVEEYEGFFEVCDVNYNNKIDVGDVVLLSQYLAKWSVELYN